MIHLSELTPAEVYILTKENITHRELLKITFIDLLLKQVLKSFEVQRQSHPRNKIRTYNYVGIGQNFKSYQPKPHEKFFLTTFDNDSEIELLFRNFVKIAYEKSRTLTDFKKTLTKSHALKKSFSQNIFQRLFQRYSYTEYGTELKRKVKKEIKDLNLELSGLDNAKNQKALELMMLIGGNIFLLENIDYDLLNQIDSDLFIEMNRKEPATDGGLFDLGWSFGNYSLSFDSSCSSGCSSGCSGCSGCGGD